jgi:hypothetical protein
MSRTGGETSRVRLALALVVGGLSALLAQSMLVDSHSSAALAAVAAAVVATVVERERPRVTVARVPLALPQRSVDRVPAHLAGRVTDTSRSPLRPRAPGLV